MRPFSLVAMFGAMSVHERIRERRLKLGLSYESMLARINAALPADVPPIRAWQAIQQWETKTAPRRKYWTALALSLETTAQWLMHGDVPDPQQLSAEALQWAARYEAMSPTERRKFKAAMILAADAVPDEEVAAHLPPAPVSSQ